MRARVQVDRGEVEVDLARPVSLAIDLDFAAPQPRHFGAPPAASRAYSVPGFPGSVALNASCNCSIVTLVPHCNGTHTECVGHLTADPLDAHRLAPLGPIPALLISLTPVESQGSGETTEPAPRPGDSLITRHALAAGWPRERPFEPRALVIRTLPNDPEKMRRDYTSITPPYFSRAAVEFIVERGIEHLVVDLPSIDRAHDEGLLTSHRIFFGLPRGSRARTEARRPHSTITELAFVPDELPDGAYLLEIQVPAIGGDAVPSRPLLYELERS